MGKLGNSNLSILDSDANNITADDSWHTLITPELPSGLATTSINLSELLHKSERLDVILPLTDTVAATGLLHETLALINNRTSRIGVWLDTSAESEQLDTLLAATKDKDNTLLHGLDLVVLYMPSFVDGRSFSQARHLRQLGFEGEIRITGDFGHDQIAYLLRAGIDSFVVTNELLTANIGSAFTALPSAYDGSDASKLPMFRKC